MLRYCCKQKIVTGHCEGGVPGEAVLSYYLTKMLRYCCKQQIVTGHCEGGVPRETV